MGIRDDSYSNPDPIEAIRRGQLREAYERAEYGGQAPYVDSHGDDLRSQQEKIQDWYQRGTDTGPQSVRD